MQLCPRCLISRTLSRKSPLLKSRYLPQQFPRASSSWSHLSQQHLLSNRSTKGRLTSKLRQPRNYSTQFPQPSEEASEPFEDILPICCPGCGAYSQTVEPNEPGYYNKTRKQLRKLYTQKRRATAGGGGGGDEEEPKHKGLGEENVEDSETDFGHEDGTSTSESQELKKQHAPPSEGVTVTALNPASGNLVKEVKKDTKTAINHLVETSKPPDPFCERCHDLINHNKAISAPTPSVYSIREFLNESPHRDNRVYHVIDAADFPMSLIPEVYEALSLQDQRSRNRRAKTEKYKWGRKLPTISFVITRSDLLAATKEQVDSKMKHMREVLREVLGKSNEQVRLGNVHMISAKRGWWTKNVKEEIRDHGGGIWVAGKTNAGKSNFIEACFPKDSRNVEKIAELVRRREQEGGQLPRQEKNAADLLDSDSLLPPAPREDLYPTFPIISSLPGTTVSPIRIPFGNGKGEMIDLPGLGRSGLEDYVRDEHKRDLIMTKRQKPDRISIKYGQSLLLGGGLVRITPVNLSDSDVLLAACFLPLETHITKTEKATEMQTQRRRYPGENILEEGTGDIISSAGIFDLKWDVTNSHLPARIVKTMEEQGTEPPVLPYKVMSTDILVEGSGWIELTMQIRKKPHFDDDVPVPQVEIFSPKGQHIGSRLPLECFNFIAQKRKSNKRKMKSRPQSVGHKWRTLHGAKV